MAPFWFGVLIALFLFGLAWIASKKRDIEIDIAAVEVFEQVKDWAINYEKHEERRKIERQKWEQENRELKEYFKRLILERMGKKHESEDHSRC